MISRWLPFALSLSKGVFLFLQQARVYAQVAAKIISSQPIIKPYFFPQEIALPRQKELFPRPASSRALRKLALPLPCLSSCAFHRAPL
jgi:hypothetical protein